MPKFGKKGPKITGLLFLFNILSFVQIGTLIFDGDGRAHSHQSFQNSKFAISLQYLKKEVRDEFDFSNADKHQSFLQVDTIIIDEHDQAVSKYSKLEVCDIFTISQKRS